MRAECCSIWVVGFQFWCFCLGERGVCDDAVGIRVGTSVDGGGVNFRAEECEESLELFIGIL